MSGIMTPLCCCGRPWKEYKAGWATPFGYQFYPAIYSSGTYGDRVVAQSIDEIVEGMAEYYHPYDQYEDYVLSRTHPDAVLGEVERWEGVELLDGRIIKPAVRGIAGDIIGYGTQPYRRLIAHEYAHAYGADSGELSEPNKYEFEEDALLTEQVYIDAITFGTATGGASADPHDPTESTFELGSVSSGTLENLRVHDDANYLEIDFTTYGATWTPYAPPVNASGWWGAKPARWSIRHFGVDMRFDTPVYDHENSRWSLVINGAIHSHATSNTWKYEGLNGGTRWTSTNYGYSRVSIYNHLTSEWDAIGYNLQLTFTQVNANNYLKYCPDGIVHWRIAHDMHYDPYGYRNFGSDYTAALNWNDPMADGYEPDQPMQIQLDNINFYYTPLHKRKYAGWLTYTNRFPNTTTPYRDYDQKWADILATRDKWTRVYGDYAFGETLTIRGRAREPREVLVEGAPIWVKIYDDPEHPIRSTTHYELYFIDGVQQFARNVRDVVYALAEIPTDDDILCSGDGHTHTYPLDPNADPPVVLPVGESWYRLVEINNPIGVTDDDPLGYCTYRYTI